MTLNLTGCSIREVEVKFMGRIDPGVAIDDITFTVADLNVGNWRL
jgi:hypothetical protein